jgi:hypothetical protein
MRREDIQFKTQRYYIAQPLSEYSILAELQHELATSLVPLQPEAADASHLRALQANFLSIFQYHITR